MHSKFLTTMKTLDFASRAGFLAILFFFIFLTACDKEEDLFSNEDATEVTSESLTDAYFEDVDGITAGAIESENSPAGGRVAEDERLHCAIVTFSEGSNSSEGSLTIDFSANNNGYCQDLKGNIRKGKIHIAYSNGPAGAIGFTTVTTFEDYSINDIQLEGTRTIERVEPSVSGRIKHDITLTNGKATWPDNSFATRAANLTGEWDVTAGIYYVEGSASGANRRSKEYTMNILETLVYKKTCTLEGIYMATEGIKVLETDARELTIDFGDGECDRTVTASVSGISREITVGE